MAASSTGAAAAAGLSSKLTIKWVGLAAAIWIQAFAGNAYLFPHYSPKLKSVLGYSQFQLNNLAVAKDIGENVGLLTGYLSNKIPAWSILLLGGFECFLGYGVIWLVVSQRLSPISYWQMALAICIGANSATFFNTAVLVTIMRNFPQSRGTVVGILKGFVGLSGAIFTQLYTAFLMKNPTSLLLLLSVSPLTVCLFSMTFVRPVPDAAHDPEEKRNFFLVHLICVSLAVYLLVATIVQNLLPGESFTAYAITTGIMLLFLVAPVFVALKLVLGSCFRKEQTPGESAEITEPLFTNRSVDFHIGSTEDDDVDGDEVVNGVKAEDLEEQPGGETRTMAVSESVTSFSEAEIDNDSELLMAVSEGAVPGKKRRPRRGEDFNLRQSLLKADFWLLFFTFFCGVGSGVTAINNLGQIGQAQGYKDVTLFVTLIGIFNFLGRLGGGTLTEKYVRLGIPRTVWSAAAQILMIFAHLAFAWAGPWSLPVGSVILGVCYGVLFSVMIPTASELFGLKHFGKIYNFLTIGDPLGSLLFSGLIAGYLYDREAVKDTPAGVQDSQCFGAHCFRLTFLLMAGVCIVGAAASIYMSVRIKPVYRSLYKSGQPVRSSH